MDGDEGAPGNVPMQEKMDNTCRRAGQRTEGMCEAEGTFGQPLHRRRFQELLALGEEPGGVQSSASALPATQDASGLGAGGTRLLGGQQ